MNRVALVIMYSGQEPSAYIKDKLAQMLITNRISDGNSDINIYFFNEEEVAHSLTKAFENDVVSEHFRKEERTPQEAAVIYIGTLCSRSIIGGDFSYDLLSKCLESYRGGSEDERLTKSMEIIAKDYSLSRVSDSIKAKYRFGPEEYKVVCKIYDVCRKLKGE